MTNNIKIPILMYHNIGNAAVGKDKPLFVSVKRFEKQMHFLRESGYRVIDFRSLLDRLKNKALLPEKTVIITFDDGTESAYKNAFPVLKKHGFQATIFLTINYIEKKEILEKSFLKYPPLTWEQIKEMQENGITFYPHSLTHPRLTQIKPDKAYFEMQESKRILEEKLGRKMDFFAYPYGDSNGEVEGMAMKAGYSGAVLSWGGFNSENTGLYELKRIPVFERDDDLQFKLKLIFGVDKVTFGFLAKYYWGQLVKRWT